LAVRLPGLSRSYSNFRVLFKNNIEFQYAGLEELYPTRCTIKFVRLCTPLILVDNECTGGSFVLDVRN